MRLLLIDTCGETGSLAFAEDSSVVRERTLASRSASAHLVRAVREELTILKWPLRTLDGVGVVSGPGSFTGVRVGLAAAKGLCEVAGLALVTVSRLEALLAAGEGAYDVAVLDAGRGEFYTRAAGENAEEQLLGRAELFDLGRGRRVAIAEEKLLSGLAELQPCLIALTAAHALPFCEARLDERSDSVASADANYVRSARALYATGRIAAETP